jgi:5'-AMP-activated protein kinase catalytic alpha subunit
MLLIPNTPEIPPPLVFPEDLGVVMGTMPGYTMGRMIGEGGFSQVRLALHHLSERFVAVKVINKAKILDPAELRRVEREIRVMRRLDHISIVKLFEVIDTPSKQYMVMEHAPMGSLLDYVRGKRRLEESQAATFFVQIAAGLQYCHQHEVVHRDVKLENILMDSSKSMKLIDFGLAAFFTPGKALKVHCGSPSYAAPEIVSKKDYEGPPVDVWSLGIVLFAMTAGHLPFHTTSGNKMELSSKILSGRFSCPDFFSVHLKNLLSQLLDTDPATRTTLAGALQHPWVQQHAAPTVASLSNHRSSHSVYYIPSARGHGGISHPALDLEVVSELSRFGYSGRELADLVSRREVGAVTAAYFLLAEGKAEDERLREELGLPSDPDSFRVLRSRSLMPVAVAGSHTSGQYEEEGQGEGGGGASHLSRFSPKYEIGSPRDGPVLSPEGGMFTRMVPVAG